MARNRKSLIIIIALLTGLAWVWQNYWRSYPMAEMEFETRTWCVGRYLVDMPVEFEMEFTNGGTGETTYVKVVPLGAGTEVDLKRVVRDRVAALKLLGARANGNYRKYKYERQIDGIYIVANEDTIAPEYHALNMPDESFGLHYAEGYFLRGGQIFHVDATILEERAEADLSDLLQVAAATYPRANDEIPEGEGLCVDGAFVRLPIFDELVRVSFKNPDVPNFGLSLSLGDQRSASRINKVGGWGALGRSRQVSGQNGVEMRIIGESVRFKYSGGENVRLGDPYTSVGAGLFKQKQPVDAPPYGVEEMHAIWNQMLNSVRRR